MAVVGIDLGTTNTVIAAVRDGRAAALKDQLGRALLPSAVSFPPKGEAKIGQEAKDRRTIDPENTVFSIKRLIGRTWDSEQVKRAKDRFPFQLKEGPGKGVLVSCGDRDYTLPEISALVLGRAREIAEARLGRAVSDAVITVPANFNDLQRAATKVAGRTAGLQVLRILNEPTAAALAYGFGKKGRERIAVYDFGGGTFDVTLLDLSENVFEVLATAGDTFLGGDDLDESIAEMMGEQLMQKHRVDMTRDPLVREQLRAAAEKLKIELSTRSMATLHVPDVLGDGSAFEFSMRRSEFEKLAEPYIVRTLEVCQQALDVASVGVAELDQVLLVGGSTRIPLVRRRISSFFGKMPQSRINPDEVVAIGAAIQAAALESKMGVSELPGPPGSVPPTGRTSAFPASPGVRTGNTQTDLGGMGRPPGTTQTGLAGLKKTLPGTTTSPLRPSAPPRTDAPRPMQSTLSGVGSAPPPALGQELPGASGRTANAQAGKLSPLAQTLSGVGEFTQLEVPRTERGIGPGNAPPPKTVPGVGRQLTAEPLGPRTLTGIGTAPTGAALASLGRPPAAGDDFDDVTSVMQSPAVVAPRPPLGSESFELGSSDNPAAGAPRPPLGSEVDDSSMFGGVPNAAPPGPAEDGSVSFDLGDLVAAAEAELAAADDIDLDLPAPAVPRGLEPFDEDLALPAVSAGRQVLDADLVSLAPDEDVTDLPARSVPPPPADDDVTDLPALSQPPPRARGFDLDLDDEPALPARSEHPPAARSPGLPSPAGATGVGLPARAAAPLPARGQVPLPAAASPGLPSALGAGLPQFAQPALPTPAAAPPIPAAAPPIPAAAPPIPAAAPPARAPRPLETTQASPGFAHQATLLEPPGQKRPASVPPPPAFGGFGAPGLTADRLRPTLDDVPAVQPPAASVGGHLGGHRAPLLLDVTPLSLGVETVSGFVDTLIERNSPIPCERTRTFATARDNQTVVRIRVSQGNANRFADNTVLGEVELPGIAPGPRGSVKVDVTFALDESGMLHVSARDRRTGHARDAHLRLLGIAEPQ